MLKPEYVYGPQKLVRRLIEPFRSPPELPALTDLSWGMKIRIAWEDPVTTAILRRGIYDLPVAEALWRLLEPGDAVADVGANIGLYTGLAALRVGTKGGVVALEPHPRVFGELKRNVERWRKRDDVAPISIQELAASDSDGSVALCEPPGFRDNHGRAFVSASRGCDETRESSRSVRAARLDSVAERDGPFDLVKIDVEGHERQVMGGAERTIGSQGARDVIYEVESGETGGLVTRELRRRGYTVFRIHSRWWGPHLEPLDGEEVPASGSSSYLPSSNLATRDPSRARRKMMRKGWRCLSGA